MISHSTTLNITKASHTFDVWIAAAIVQGPSGLEYSSDIAAAYLMEESIACRGLWREYSHFLASVVGTSTRQADGTTETKVDLWNLAHATPLQRCQAAYRLYTAE